MYNIYIFFDYTHYFITRIDYTQVYFLIFSDYAHIKPPKQSLRGYVSFRPSSFLINLDKISSILPLRGYVRYQILLTIPVAFIKKFLRLLYFPLPELVSVNGGLLYYDQY